MALIPLQLLPGVLRNGTDFESSNRWRDANLVRWRNGSLRPVGGWDTRKASATASVPRGIHAWLDNSSASALVLGTHDKLIYVNESGTLSDITPTGLTAGDVDASVNVAFGGGFWGLGLYGITRPSTGVYEEATTWALDNWGEYLIACSSTDGKIYEWQLNTSVLPTALTNAPVGNNSMLVTEERFVFALGAGGNPRKVAWCDREANTVWTPAATNEAGDFELVTSGQIMCGLRMRGATLILTDTDAHIATYSGAPFVYGFERVGTACGVVSRKAAVAIDQGAFWLGANGFFMFDGSIATELKSDVHDYIFNDISSSQISKAYAVHNSQHSEIWWFYTSESSTENDSYVTYNYKEGHWAVGSLDRTAGVDKGVFDFPIWADASGDLFHHEYGLDHGSSTPFAESGSISFGNGDQIMKVTNLIPDELTQGDVKVTFKTRFHPNDTERTYGAYTLANPTAVRFSGRQIRIRIESNKLADWRAGVMRIEAKPGGGR
tara:strand:+ start:924 stop:2402 length:1479 start_codon:yes stop_codon:yes gene_type:complete